MAKTSMIVKASREPKYSTRTQNRCQRCGRPHSVYRKFGLCRVCLRELASKGELPGVTKASWEAREDHDEALGPRARVNRPCSFITN